MATAPLLLLIVAAVPPLGLRGDALPAGAPAPAARDVVVAAAPSRACAVALCDADEQPAPRALAEAPAPLTKRPAKEPVVEALETPPLDPERAPLLVPRTEPKAAQGPPR